MDIYDLLLAGYVPCHSFPAVLVAVLNKHLFVLDYLEPLLLQ
jgi:hypothetical protein